MAIVSHPKAASFMPLLVSGSATGTLSILYRIGVLAPDTEKHEHLELEMGIEQWRRRDFVKTGCANVLQGVSYGSARTPTAPMLRKGRPSGQYGDCETGAGLSR